MRLYTRTGDKGETGLIGGKRVRKDHPRVDAYGRVDELNAAIGLAAAACNDPDWCGRLRLVQETLFSLGTELADPGARGSTPAVRDTVGDADIAQLEEWIDAAGASVEPLKRFVLPGGCELAARFHVARTVCRYAERGVVTLSGQVPVASAVLVYLNRLSDLLFAWARLANARAGVSDVVWPSAGEGQGDDA